MSSDIRFATPPGFMLAPDCHRYRSSLSCRQLFARSFRSTVLSHFLHVPAQRTLLGFVFLIIFDTDIKYSVTIIIPSSAQPPFKSVPDLPQDCTFRQISFHHHHPDYIRSTSGHRPPRTVTGLGLYFPRVHFVNKYR